MRSTTILCQSARAAITTLFVLPPERIEAFDERWPPAVSSRCVEARDYVDMIALLRAGVTP